MDTRTNNTNRAKKLLKLLNRLIKQEHLYSDEEILEYRKNIKSIKEEIDRIDAETFKGFGKKSYWNQRNGEEILPKSKDWIRNLIKIKGFSKKSY